MAKLGKEHVMVACNMIGNGASVRQVASQLGVSEGALRYRLKKGVDSEEPDGRARKPTSLDGYEGAVEAILERLECRRVTGEGRPVQVRISLMWRGQFA